MLFIKQQNQCLAKKRCKCKHADTNFTNHWNNSRFRQNPAVILSEAMYLDRSHPFMQKSYLGQNVTYTFARTYHCITILLYGQKVIVNLLANLLQLKRGSKQSLQIPLPANTPPPTHTHTSAYKAYPLTNYWYNIA